MKKRTDGDPFFYKRQRTGRERNGFSLVEILIVLVILAIVGAGAAMIVGKGSEKAKFVTAQKDLDIIQNAFTRYYNLTWSFEGLVDGAGVDSCFTGEFEPGVDRQEVLRSFFGRELSDYKDPWGRPYILRTNYDPVTNTGIVLVTVQEIAGMPVYEPESMGGMSLGRILSDRITKQGGVEAPMYRIIYNTAF